MIKTLHFIKASASFAVPNDVRVHGQLSKLLVKNLFAILNKH